MKIIATKKSEQNHASVDPWTVVHLSTGLAMGLVNVPLRAALTSAIVYELVEQVFERHERGKSFFRTSGPEVLHNAIVDTVVFALGHWLGRKWNKS